MRNVIYYSELYHHGVKGQKWGNRNYQNEDGSYTAQGQAENNGHGRYYKSKTDWYPLIGAAVGAGVLLGAGALFYYSVKSGHISGADIVIPGRQILQRISPADEKDLNDIFYASFGKHDNKRYEGLIKFHYKYRGYNEVNIKKMHLNKDLKIAGSDTGTEVLQSVVKKLGLEFDAPISKKDYEVFNKNIVSYRFIDKNSDTFKIYDEFFKELNLRGYDGLVDTNDQLNSGYMSKAPLIIFNKDVIKGVDIKRDIINTPKNNKLNKVELNKALLERKIVDLSNEEKVGYAYFLSAIGAVAGGSVGSAVKSKKEKEENNKKS